MRIGRAGRGGRGGRAGRAGRRREEEEERRKKSRKKKRKRKRKWSLWGNEEDSWVACSFRSIIRIVNLIDWGMERTAAAESIPVELKHRELRELSRLT